MSTYTYKPSEISSRSVSRARFELGDVMVDGGEETCYLADEEIEAVLAETSGWKRCLFRLADAVCMRLSFETNWRDDGTAFDLNQRAERWMKLRDRFEKEAEIEACTPQSGAVEASLRNEEDGGHYFYGGMQQSPYVKPPLPFEGDTGC
jgi:hypothetical protein